MAKKQPPYVPVHPRLDNERHEQFARCLAAKNLPQSCWIGVGYPPDEEAAVVLADTKTIRLRTEEIYRQNNPHSYKQNGYVHVTDNPHKMKS